MDYSSDASWRTNRLNHFQLLERMLASKRAVSPVFTIPWLQSSCFKIDWLHCADLGVAADFIGNALRLVVRKFPGDNVSQRYDAMWNSIQEFYRQNKVGDQLQNLRPGMLKQSDKPPKLRASAAQRRALVPWVREVCSDKLNPNDPMEQAVQMGAYHLDQCYKSLSSGSILAKDFLKEHTTRFASLYVALGRMSANPLHWRPKPKLHLFLELGHMGGSPSMCWTYRDEDYGGMVARLARRRGGGC